MLKDLAIIVLIVLLGVCGCIYLSGTEIWFAPPCDFYHGRITADGTRHGCMWSSYILVPRQPNDGLPREWIGDGLPGVTLKSITP